MPYLFAQLIKFGFHNRSKCQGRIVDIEIYKVVDRGLNTTLYLKCRNCKFHEQFYTNKPVSKEEPTLKEAAVISVLGSKSTFASFKTSLMVFDIPCPSKSTFTKWRQEFTKPLHQALKKVLDANALEEQRLARENGDVVDNIPCCTVIFDGNYGKRSFPGGKYDSLGGVIAIIGYRTQKLIDLVIYNKHCVICSKAASLNQIPVDHECFSNYDPKKSSTSMEVSGVVEAFNRSIEVTGMIYNVYISDDDSSIENGILKADPYKKFGIKPKKIKCTNHLFRSMGTKIRQASKAQAVNRERGVMGTLRKNIKGSAIKIRRVVEKEVKRLRKDLNNDDDLSIEEKCAIFDSNAIQLQSNILLVPYHVLGQHNDCPLSWSCDKSKPNFVPKLKELKLFDRIIKIVSDLSKNSAHLLHEVTTNIVEQFFSITRQYNCDKGYNFYKRDDYEKRMIIAAIHQATSGAALSEVFLAINKKVPSLVVTLEKCNKAERLCDAVSRKNNKNKKKSQHACRGTDEDYGPHANKPDKSDKELQEAIENHNQVLRDRQDNRLKYETETINKLQYGCAHDFEKDMISTTFLGKICRMAETTSCANVIASILCEPLDLNDETLQSWQYHRNRAIQYLQDNVIHDKVSSCGLRLSSDKECFYLLARPDGIVRQDSIVIVCNVSTDQNCNLTDALNSKIWTKLFSAQDSQEINKDHPMYYNIQGQLHVTGFKYCYLAVYTVHESEWIKVANKIVRDDQFWIKKIKAKIERFYNSSFIFEVVDSRANRSMPIREAPHTIAARKKQDEKKREKNLLTMKKIDTQPTNLDSKSTVVYDDDCDNDSHYSTDNSEISLIASDFSDHSESIYD